MILPGKYRWQMDAQPCGRDYIYYSAAWNSIVTAILNKRRELGKRSTLQVAMIISRVHEVSELIPDKAVKELSMGFEDCYISQLYCVDFEYETEITQYEDTIALVPVAGYEKCSKCMHVSSGWSLQSTLGPVAGRFFCSEECALSMARAGLIGTDSLIAKKMSDEIAEAISNPLLDTPFVAMAMGEIRIAKYE